MRKLVFGLSVAQILPEKINKTLSPNKLVFIDVNRTVDPIEMLTDIVPTGVVPMGLVPANLAHTVHMSRDFAYTRNTGLVSKGIAGLVPTSFVNRILWGPIQVSPGFHEIEYTASQIIESVHSIPLHSDLKG